MRTQFIGLLGAALLAVPMAVQAAVVVSDYMIIANAPGGIGDALDMSNAELGKIGTKGTPTSLPAKPSGARGTSSGVTYDGDVAITRSTGKVKLSNSDVYSAHAGSAATDDLGRQGIDCASTYGTCNPSSIDSNSRFDTPAAAPASNFANGNGIQGGQAVSGLLTELASHNAAYWAGMADFNSTISLSSGEVTNNSNYLLSYGAGLNFVNIDTNGNDFKLTNSNWIVSGDANTFVVFVIEDAGRSFVANNSRLLLSGDIGVNNILFLVDSDGTSFNFNNVEFFGYSFWDIGGRKSDNYANFNDVIGCGQVVNDRVTLSDVSMSGCAFNYVDLEPPHVPLPAAAWLLLSGLGGLGILGRRRKPA